MAGIGKPHSNIHGKLCKKVAELTMVVHMLFKRNHEKEIELEAFKIMYDKEISRIQQQATDKVAWLEKELDGQEDFRAKAEYKFQDLDEFKNRITKLQESNQKQLETIIEKDNTIRQLSLQENLLKQKLKLADERVQGLLAPANSEDEDRNMSSLQLGPPNNFTDPNHDNTNGELHLENKIKNLEEEITNIKNSNAKELKELTNEKNELQRKLDNYNLTLNGELDELKTTLDKLSQKQIDDIEKLKVTEKSKKDLESKLKKAEDDKRLLQSRLQLFQDQLKNALSNRTDIRKKNQLVRNVVSQGAKQRNVYEDNELERLRREVEWYKRELVNRESNFNRMFTTQQPVIVADNEETSFLLERNLTGTRRGRRKQQLPQLDERKPGMLFQTQQRTLHL